MDHRARTTWNDIAERIFRGVVSAPDYPCLGARSVLHRGRATVKGYPQLGSDESAALLLDDLAEFARTTDTTDGFASFVAVFTTGGSTGSEEDFEKLLWRQLQSIHDLDGAKCDAMVCADPGDPHFGFSAAGTAYFVIGLHPGASRPARQSPLPMLVFNPHAQFRQLRECGRFARMRDTIRRRDAAANGSVNPMVADYGDLSEARQYFGRVVDDDWAPPFIPRQRRRDTA